MANTHESHPDWALLARSVTGAADEHDAMQLERWVGSDPARRRFVDSMRTLWREAGTPVERVDVDDALARIKGLRPLRRRILRFPGAEDTERGVRLRRAIWSVARIAVTGGVAAAVVLWLNAQRDSAADAGRARISEVTTVRRERAELRLPDGTRLVLAPASKVRYANDYGVERREVSLEGQALFVVAHDGRRPFVVRTPRTVATDLGTTFVVRDYGEDRSAEVMIAEGKVELARSAGGRAQGQPPRPAATLEAGDLAMIESDGRVRVRRGVAAEPYVAWSQGRLMFDDTPLAEVLAQISRWYDVEARVEDSIAARRRLTASYSTEPLTDILPLIAASLDLHVERHGRVITFRARRAFPIRGAS